MAHSQSLDAENATTEIKIATSLKTTGTNFFSLPRELRQHILFYSFEECKIFFVHGLQMVVYRDGEWSLPRRGERWNSEDSFSGRVHFLKIQATKRMLKDAEFVSEKLKARLKEYEQKRTT